MPINTLATATLFQNTLDKVAIREAVTGWMDANAGQVIYNGGAEVKIPKMSVQGLGDYDRDNGYQQGGVTLEYETRKMTQDRGRKFQLDPIDINENNFVTTAAAVMGEFQRVFDHDGEHGIPEYVDIIFKPDKFRGRLGVVAGFHKALDQGADYGVDGKSHQED